MMEGLYANAASMKALQKQHDAISMNLANLSTAGYKKRVVSFQSHMKEASETMLPQFPRQIVCDLSPGHLRNSGRKLDLALDGEGFFAVQTARGERFTRRGDFTTNPAGELVTRQGFRVQSTGGSLVIKEGKETLIVDSEGSVKSSGESLGNLKVVSFPKGTKLVPEGGGLFKSNLPPEGPAEARVRQGYIEGSNVDPMQEMVEMITCLRQYEANQKAIETMRVALEKAVNI